MFQSTEQFIAKWKLSSEQEIAEVQAHFVELCELLGEPAPGAVGFDGHGYGFEKHVGKARGGRGFVDVWRGDHFAWEYQGRHKDLKRAYRQLSDYREELGNPPMLVVCDLERFEVHTNFAEGRNCVYEFTLEELERNEPTAACPVDPMHVLRALFVDCDALRPERVEARAAEEAARLFAKFVERLQLEGREPEAGREGTARFLAAMLICLFADGIGLLPDHLFRRMVGADRSAPKRFQRKLKRLFEAMMEEDGIFGEHTIRHFNAELFDAKSMPELDEVDLGILHELARKFDWSQFDALIAGTLFERAMTASRREQIGSPYAREEDVLALLEPVLLRPLRRRWNEVRAAILEQREAELWEEPADNRGLKSARMLREWLDELAQVRVLDPACGTGNFLVVALRKLRGLWLEAVTFAAGQGIPPVAPEMVSLGQFAGFETELYAHELASFSMWMEDLQWKHEHGLMPESGPALAKPNIERADAILRYGQDGLAHEPVWPKVDVIVGHLPSVSDKQLRGALGEQYVSDLLSVYKARVPQEANLAGYWFSKALAEVQAGDVRVGFVAPYGMKGGANKAVLTRVTDGAAIFFVASSYEWPADGTSDGKGAKVSLIAFDDGTEKERELDGRAVAQIQADLKAGNELSRSEGLEENEDLAYQGAVKAGHFEVDPETARRMLFAAVNVRGQSNVRVVVPWINADDLLERPHGMQIVDFQGMDEREAALFEMPFEYVRERVYAKRQMSSRDRRRRLWWQHGTRNIRMRRALGTLERYIATPRVAKHRFFRFVPAETLADSSVVVIARSDDYFIGLLESSIHRCWSMTRGERVGEEEVSYDVETCFAAFPFPLAPGKELSEAEDRGVKAIAAAARELMRLRVAWMNPPKASAEELKGRTLTALFNARPDWLTAAHRTLDEAVFAAYGWPANLSKDEILSRLMALNRERSVEHEWAVEMA